MEGASGGPRLMPPRRGADAGTWEVDAGRGDACGDGLDGDRDGLVDEDCMCAAGEQQRCFRGDPALAGVGARAWGIQDCVVMFEVTPGTSESRLRPAERGAVRRRRQRLRRRDR
ncbi:MAG: hypothetical protein M5U28_45530 [Sandaracinaceae bacterium]|nr:hypothetical protein [Sandaracinaceae bacterium]